VDKKELIKFRKASASGSGSRNFLKDTSTLRDFSTVWLLFLDRVIGFSPLTRHDKTVQSPVYCGLETVGDCRQVSAVWMLGCQWVGRSGTYVTGAPNNVVILTPSSQCMSPTLIYDRSTELLNMSFVTKNVDLLVMLTLYTACIIHPSHHGERLACVKNTPPGERSGSLHTTSSFDRCYCAVSHRSSMLLAFLPAFTKLALGSTACVGGQGR